MQAIITAWHESAHCTWCEQEKEAVTVDFGDGFIRSTPLCWKCLNQAVRVRHGQERGRGVPLGTVFPLAPDTGVTR